MPGGRHTEFHNRGRACLGRSRWLTTDRLRLPARLPSQFILPRLSTPSCAPSRSSRIFPPIRPTRLPRIPLSRGLSSKTNRPTVAVCIPRPRIFRDAMELQHARQYSTSQVAEELGVSVSAAKSRLMRARKTVRRRLSGTRPRNGSKPVSSRGASRSGVDSKTASILEETV